MPCFHPLKGFPIGFTKDGKRDMRIVPYGVHHLEVHNGRIRTVDVPEISPYSEKTYLEWLEIPCGHCDGCRIQRSREWANRCMMEMEYHDSAYFVTLTYNEEHVPKSWAVYHDTGEAFEHMTLCKRDLQLFMKRLRKAFPNDHIRYFACGEYGSTTFRPHYHLIIYGLHLDDIVPIQDVQKGQLSYKYFTSKSLQDVWSVLESNHGEYDTPDTKVRVPLGFVAIGNVTWETCAYTARYVMKKQYGEDASVYEKLNIEPEFVVMSRRPGIGRQWYDDHPDLYDYDYINISTEKGGIKFRPPKYFDKLLEVDDPDRMCQLKDARRHFAEESKKKQASMSTMSYQELLEVKERNLRSKIKSLRRDL